MLFKAGKLKKLKSLTGEANEDILLFYLDTAEATILERLYPFGTSEISVPEKYELKQIEIALYLYNKRGAEGEIAHNENGISRTYESAGVPDSMLKGIVPFASVLSRKEGQR